MNWIAEKEFLLITTLILSSSLTSDTTTLKNGKVYHNAKVFHKGDTVIVSFECGKQIVFNKSEISETEIKPLTRWKTQEECDQAEEEARQAAEKRKEEEAKRKEEKRLQEEQRRQELALKKQECETKGNTWNGKDCRKKSVTPVILTGGKWSEYQGKMNWEDAEKKCESIGMRLPTIDELRKAYALKETERWKKDGTYTGSYWSSTKTGDEDAYSLYIYNGYSRYNNRRSSMGIDVRCIRSKGIKTTIESGKWSGPQGYKFREEAIDECARIGMRLPTIKELEIAYNSKITASWTEGTSFWSSDVGGVDNTFTYNINRGDYEYRGYSHNDTFVFRCIR